MTVFNDNEVSPASLIFDAPVCPIADRTAGRTHAYVFYCCRDRGDTGIAGRSCRCASRRFTSVAGTLLCGPFRAGGWDGEFHPRGGSPRPLCPAARPAQRALEPARGTPRPSWWLAAGLAVGDPLQLKALLLSDHAGQLYDPPPGSSFEGGDVRGGLFDLGPRRRGRRDLYMALRLRELVELSPAGCTRAGSDRPRMHNTPLAVTPIPYASNSAILLGGDFRDDSGYSDLVLGCWQSCGAGDRLALPEWLERCSRNGFLRGSSLDAEPSSTRA